MGAPTVGAMSFRASLRIAGVALGAIVLCAPPAARADSPWTWPVRGEVITSFRNGADPYAAGQHRGIDIAAGVGERVVAATPGTVAFAGVAGSSGRTLSIESGDGRFTVSYLHLFDVSVTRGQRVSEGQQLGAVGTSGRRSAQAPHLHFGVREAGREHAYRDPLDFLPAAPPAPPEPAAPPPAPVLAPPARPIASPVTAPAPRRSPRPRPLAAPRRLPLRVRAPRPAGSPSPFPEPVQWASPVASPAPGGARVPTAGHGGPNPIRAPGSSPGAAAADARGNAAAPVAPARAAPALGAAPVAPLGEVASRAPRAAGAEPRDDGTDVGWIVACAGALLAAAAAGRPERARAAARTGRRALGSIRARAAHHARE